MTYPELSQKTQEFINYWMGKKLDTDGYPLGQPYQCVDIVKQFHAEVLQAPMFRGNAINYWYDYPYSTLLQKYYDRIPNTLTFVPRLGDVMVWKGWWSNPYGHIALCTNAGNMLWFTSFDQNWKGPYCTYVAHNYTWPRVLGVLRPKV